MKRRSKSWLRSFAVTVIGTVVFCVLWFGYKFVVIQFFQQAIDEVNPPPKFPPFPSQQRKTIQDEGQDRLPQPAKEQGRDAKLGK
jgi:4-hydroxybenzoate polyprenyltransferase